MQRGLDSVHSSELPRPHIPALPAALLGAREDWARGSLQARACGWAAVVEHRLSVGRQE